jgi:hypothetical protein
LRKNWSERYFVLTISTGQLAYYKPASANLLGNTEDGVAKGTITLRPSDRALSPFTTVRR